MEPGPQKWGPGFYRMCERRSVMKRMFRYVSQKGIKGPGDPLIAVVDQLLSHLFPSATCKIRLESFY